MGMTGMVGKIGLAGDKQFQGFIKFMNHAAGFGLISCDETYMLFARDVFLHQSQFGRFNVGDAVLFKVDIDVAKGSPRAYDLQPAPLVSDLAQAMQPSSANELYGLHNFHGMSNPEYVVQPVGAQVLPPLQQALLEQQQEQEQLLHLQLKMMQQAQIMQQQSQMQQQFQPITAPTPDFDGKQRFVGVIKSFNKAAGFGFISCDETHTIFGRDVFLHNSHRQGQDMGDVVSFSIEMVRNQPRAKDLQTIGNVQDIPSTAKLKDPNQSFLGLVKSYSFDKGFGFIACEETFPIYGLDIFLHRNQADGIDVGDTVRFNVEVNNKGQPQARNVLNVQSGDHCQNPNPLLGQLQGFPTSGPGPVRPKLGLGRADPYGRVGGLLTLGPGGSSRSLS